MRLVSVGRAVEKKGYDVLLDALARLPAELNWRLTHIGGGELLAGLQERAAARGLGGRVDWRGPQDQSAVIAALKAGDLFVLAARIAADGDRDGLPNVLMEAQATGLACLATTVSAIPELIVDGVTGRLVSARRPAGARPGAGAADPGPGPAPRPGPGRGGAGAPGLRLRRRARPVGGPVRPRPRRHPPAAGVSRLPSIPHPPMRIAFHAPLKPPDHPVPSGDRRVARLFLAALREAGHAATVASRLRSWDDASVPGRQARLAALATGWAIGCCAAGRPDRPSGRRSGSPITCTTRRRT